MADCYSGNMSVVLAPGSKMTRMACWAHARRKVYEHQESDPQVSALPLALMNQLYDIERRATQKSDQERGELRAKESRRILDRIQPSTCQAHHILAAYILKAHRFARIYATLCSAKLDAE